MSICARIERRNALQIARAILPWVSRDERGAQDGETRQRMRDFSTAVEQRLLRAAGCANFQEAAQ